MGIAEVITAPRSPWQNACVERVIGSIRRECLDHIVIFNVRHLRRVLSSYVDYYHRTRTHRSLDKDCPESRPVMPRRVRKCRRHPQSRWSAPPLRTARCLTRTTPANQPRPRPIRRRLRISVSKAFDLELKSNCDSARSPFHFFSSIRWQFSPTDHFMVPSQFSVATPAAYLF
jgi:hypothetical protein